MRWCVLVLAVAGLFALVQEPLGAAGSSGAGKDAQSDEGAVLLVEQGAARCRIVAVGPDAARPAAELAGYLERVSGAKVPVVALDGAVGTDKSEPAGGGGAGSAASGGADGPPTVASARASGNAGSGQSELVLGGSAAVERARRLGVRCEKAEWERLSAEGYIMRSSPRAVLLAGKSELALYYAADRFLEKELGVRWFMPGEIGEVVPEGETRTLRIGPIDERWEPSFAMRWVGRGGWARRNGMNVAVDCGGEFKVKWFVHTFTRLLPPEQYAADHPEYYALVNDKRVGQSGKPSRIQLCTSNPDVVREVAANIIKIREAEPDLKMISLDPMDSQIFCQCDRCRALDEAGAGPHNAVSRRLVLFYNQVADLVRGRFPDLLLKSIAYQKYAAPPLDPSVTLGDTNVIQLCHFMCHNHALSDPSCPYNRAYGEYLMGWRERAKKVALYEYYNKVSWLELPWPIVHTLRKDIPWFRDLGLFGLATQYRENLGSNGLVYYVAARLLRDPDTDVDALLEDFYKRFYAEAAGPMRDYYESLEEAAARSGLHLARQRPYAEAVALFTPELLKKLDGCVARAERAAESKKVRARVALVRASLEYAKVCVEYLRALDTVRRESPTPWVGDEVVKRARAVGAPYEKRIRALLEAGAKVRAVQPNMEGGYIQRALDPVSVVLSWDTPDLGFGEPVRWRQRQGSVLHFTDRGAGARTEGAGTEADAAKRVTQRKGSMEGHAPSWPPGRMEWGQNSKTDATERVPPKWATKADAAEGVPLQGATPADVTKRVLPERVSIWVVGRDFDWDANKAECELWALDGSGRKVVIGPVRVAGKGRGGGQAESCFAFDNEEAAAVIGQRGKAVLFVTNTEGGWTRANLLAVYVMPGPRPGPEDPMARMRADLDGVRSEALGFIEFEGGGLPIRDGETVGLEIEIPPSTVSYP